MLAGAPRPRRRPSFLAKMRGNGEKKQRSGRINHYRSQGSMDDLSLQEQVITEEEAKEAQEKRREKKILSRMLSYASSTSTDRTHGDGGEGGDGGRVLSGHRTAVGVMNDGAHRRKAQDHTLRKEHKKAIAHRKREAGVGGAYEAGGRGLSSYAAGLVHTNDIIDGLLCQTYFNPEMLVFSEALLGAPLVRNVFH